MMSTKPITISVHPRSIRSVLRMALAECSGAVAGTSLPITVVRRTGAGLRRPARTSFWACGWPETRSGPSPRPSPGHRSRSRSLGFADRWDGPPSGPYGAADPRLAVGSRADASVKFGTAGQALPYGMPESVAGSGGRCHFRGMDGQILAHLVRKAKGKAKRRKAKGGRQRGHCYISTMTG
jgi:hypothetical protein